MISVFLFIFCAFYQPAKALADMRVRKIQVTSDQIVQVKTAIGIATIIQVPDRPNSIVVGDQNAFKVEYLDQAITIKPLQAAARSNLYIYTDFRRFNVQLVTAQESIADYVVYFENPEEKVSQVSWVKYKNQLKNESLILETRRIAKTRDGILLVEFDISSEKNEKIRPEWIWLTQNQITRPIHNLVLSGQEVSLGKSIRGVLQILRADISEKEPLKIELRIKKTSYLTLPKVASWK